jgi:hypothetical protein
MYAQYQYLSVYMFDFTRCADVMACCITNTLPPGPQICVNA